jgi:hypothetical protein
MRSTCAPMSSIGTSPRATSMASVVNC